MASDAVKKLRGRRMSESFMSGRPTDAEVGEQEQSDADNAQEQEPNEEDTLSSRIAKGLKKLRGDTNESEE